MRDRGKKVQVVEQKFLFACTILSRSEHTPKDASSSGETNSVYTRASMLGYRGELDLVIYGEKINQAATSRKVVVVVVD